MTHNLGEYFERKLREYRNSLTQTQEEIHTLDLEHERLKYHLAKQRTASVSSLQNPKKKPSNSSNSSSNSNNHNNSRIDLTSSKGSSPAEGLGLLALGFKELEALKKHQGRELRLLQELNQNTGQFLLLYVCRYFLLHFFSHKP